MSGLAVVWHRDGRPVDRPSLDRMIAAIAHRGPDGTGRWIDGPFAMAHLSLAATPESADERQPIVDETGRYCLAFDGRVDNREELADALRARGLRSTAVTDAELVLAAFRCWGEGCPARIVGDFAFAVWDRAARTLVCARDPVGWRAFYYYADDRRFLCGSEPAAILADPSVPRDPDEGMVGEHLASAITSQADTLYRAIRRLPPGHTLVVTPDRIRTHRFWEPDVAREIRYRSDREYADHFAELMTRAVACRLRARGAVGVYLSGGLDSAAIAGLCERLIRAGAVASSRLEVFSLLFPGLECDETAFIDDVAKTWGLVPHRAVAPVADPAGYVASIRRHGEFPEPPNSVMFDPLRALARDRGVRVMFTGSGGDDWLSGSPYHYADYLRRLAIGALLRELRQNSHALGIILPRAALLRVGVWPLLPAWVRAAARRALGRGRPPRWIDARFARRIDLAARIREDLGPPGGVPFARRDIARTLRAGWAAHYREADERRAAWFGLEERHPFDDRRLIEFALALPEEERWRGDETKVVLRRALGDLLPASVRERRSKADFSHVFPEEFERRGGERAFDGLAIAAAGWLDPAEVRRLYRRMARLYAQGDARYARDVWPLWMILGTELWFRTTQSQAARPSAGSGRPEPSRGGPRRRVCRAPPEGLGVHAVIGQGEAG